MLRGKRYSSQPWNELAERRRKHTAREQRWAMLGLCFLYTLIGAAAMFVAHIYHPYPWW